MKSHPAPTKKRKARKYAWPVSYRWLAAGTFAVYTAIGISTVNVAAAQTPTVSTTLADTNIPPRRYDIPAGLMGAVLDAYQERSGMHVTLAVPGIRDLRSPGVSGLYNAQQAMEQILKDTGMVSHFTGQKSVTVEPERGLASVDVNARYTAVST